jgi:hypothetical protein
MRLTASPALVLNSRAGKEAKLKEFILQDIAALQAAGRGAMPVRYTLIARAPDSVVAQTLKAVSSDIAAAGIEIAAILFESETCFEETHLPSSVLDIPDITCRFLRDQRFGAAHEQLVLSGNRVWIGDCMRRDPSKRDAFELFHNDDQAAARHASLSFNRLWAQAKPVHRVAGASALAPALLMAGDAEQPALRPVAARR